MGLKGVFGGIFALIGAGAMLVAAFNLGTIGWLSLTGASATGTVTSFRFVPPHGEVRASSRAQAVFNDHAGNQHVVEASYGHGNTMSSVRRTHELGDEVRVLYPPGRPQDAIIADWRSVAWLSFFLLFAGVFVLIGLLAIRSDRKEQNEMGWTRRQY